MESQPPVLELERFQKAKPFSVSFSLVRAKVGVCAERGEVGGGGESE